MRLGLWIAALASGPGLARVDAALAVDCNTNGVEDAQDISNGESEDCNTNAIPDECDLVALAVLLTNETDVPIPPGPAATSIINVPGSAMVADVNIILNIVHTFDADLDVLLIHAGTTVELFTDVGGSGNNFTNAVLDEQAATPITSGTPPFTGTFNPEGNLDLFNSKNQVGDWTLQLDDDTNGDTGTLLSWSLSLTRVADPDCNTNSLPDACELEDCNTNGQLDACDIGGGISNDDDSDGVPDECVECTTCFGDVNGDGRVDGEDIPCFVECLLNGSTATCMTCTCADLDDDSAVNAGDLALLVEKLLNEADLVCP